MPIIPFDVPGEYRLDEGTLTLLRQALEGFRDAADRGDVEGTTGRLATVLDVLERLRWCIAGVAVPDTAVEQLLAAPPNRRAGVAAAIEATLTGLAAKAPSVGNYVDRASEKRDSGEIPGEAARKAWSQGAAEVAAFVHAAYRRERGKFDAGRAGDIAARKAVARAMTRDFGGSYSDRHIRRIIAAAGKVSRSGVA